MLTGSKLTLASCSQVGADAGRWLWMAVRGHLGARLRSTSARFSMVRRCRTTFRFSGRTCPQVAQIVGELCAVVGRWCLPLVAAVAVTVAVSPGRDAFARLPPGVHLVTARAVEGMAPYPGQARCLALGSWPECFRRLNVRGGQRPFPEETRSALDIEGKHVIIQGPSPGPDLFRVIPTPRVLASRSRATSAPAVPAMDSRSRGGKDRP